MVAFSVIIPLFNKAPTIARAIGSALGQSFAASEIIVIDDASADGSLQAAMAFEGASVRILRRTEPGPGGYAARNLGIEEARSDWIAFLDADDEWLPDHLASIAACLEADIPADRALRTDAVFTGYMNVYADGRRVPDPYSERFGLAGARAFTFGALIETWLSLRACPIWTSASAFRREALIAAGLFPAGRCKRGGDKDLWLRVAEKGMVLACPGMSALYHRDSVNMVTRSAGTNVRHCLCETIEAMVSRQPPEQVALLHKLLNHEVFQYAVQATKTGPVHPLVWSGYRKEIGYARYLGLLAMSTPFGAALLRLARHVR
jgi:succinoglycan biosynthesis protein ExoO